MPAALQGLVADASIDAPDVELMSSIFGPGADASSSEDEDAGVGDSTASNNADASSKGRTRSVKASRLEESKAESEHRACPVGSPHPVDTDIADAAQGILSLGNSPLVIFCVFFLSLSFWLSCLRLAGVLAPGLTGKGAGEDKPVSPVRGLALEGLGGLAIGAELPGHGGPSEPA